MGALFTLDEMRNIKIAVRHVRRIEALKRQALERKADREDRIYAKYR